MLLRVLVLSLSLSPSYFACVAIAACKDKYSILMYLKSVKFFVAITIVEIWSIDEKIRETTDRVSRRIMKNDWVRIN